METSKLIGPALDWAVAKCEGYNEHEWDSDVSNMWLIRRSNQTEHWLIGYFAPSTDWSQGGPIIERERIDLRRFFSSNEWEASSNIALRYDARGEYIDGSNFAMFGPTPLIAAMRCYVASKLGDEVDIPKELQP